MNADDFTPSDAERTAQQGVVLAALQAGPVTTLELRQRGVASLASRVLELRRQGWPIVTARAGRFALYILQAGTDAAICGLAAAGAAALLSQPWGCP